MLDDLHQLIQSFTRKEIDGLNNFLLQNETQQTFIYQLLFLFLYDEGEDYSQENIASFCQTHELSSEALRVHSYHLYNKIMFYLRDPEIRSNPEWKIQCLIQDAETLKLKALFNLAKKTLKKALSIAKECQLTGWEYKIYLALIDILLKQNSIQKFDEAKEYLGLMATKWEDCKQSEKILQFNFHILLLWLQKSGNLKELAAQLDPELESIPANISFPAKIRYAQSRAIIAQLSQDKKNMLYWQQLAFEFFSQYPELKKHFPHNYLSAYDNYLMATLVIDDKPLFKTLLTGIKDLDYDDAFIISRFKALQVFMQISFWLLYKDITLTVPETEIDDILELFEDHQEVISASRKHAIIYSLGVLYFFRGNTTAALYWWGNASEVSKTNPYRPERLRLIILLLLINDYQTPDFDRSALLARIDSTRSRLRTWDKNAKGLEEHEKITIRYIRKLSNLPNRDKKGELQLLNKFYTELKAYSDKAEESQLHRSSVILRWLEYQLGC
ncbi:hypothetical protein [Lewinella cohaerens]|uniref:hypothetical protein n=1 Tax=Lewinella cohaerens TaxID=70995 RepID=UPI000366698D|nr:hypothetical protein [Lewinella cohaerens]